MRIPILKLGNLLLTSIQSDITDEQALALQTDLLRQLDKTQARGVVLDISSLDVVDSYMARILTETARMAKLMGGEVVISGMNPMVAVTLIEMGRELVGVETALNLEQGVEKLTSRLDQPEDEVAGDADHDRR
ncbi:MAG: STAS domain-containing protein [Bacteroidales bacterium]